MRDSSKVVRTLNTKEGGWIGRCVKKKDLQGRVQVEKDFWEGIAARCKALYLLKVLATFLESFLFCMTKEMLSHQDFLCKGRHLYSFLCIRMNVHEKPQYYGNRWRQYYGWCWKQPTLFRDVILHDTPSSGCGWHIVLVCLGCHDRIQDWVY